MRLLSTDAEFCEDCLYKSISEFRDSRLRDIPVEAVSKDNPGKK